ncbi:MAG: hypothetical protein HWD59_09485 [Coxiellaceae bacterium]|nr:MAG: hypothetical protein HWD59_09485 [Coxiellaceae bacterium]
MPNTRVDYIHPKQVTYGRLIRSLKSGFAIQQTLVIKDFKCHCSDHENTLKRAIVVEGINKLKRRICSFVAVADHGIAIDAEGQICIDGYCFYSTHPNWQVRAAVAFGLAKIKAKARWR